MELPHGKDNNVFKNLGVLTCMLICRLFEISDLILFQIIFHFSKMAVVQRKIVGDKH